MSITFSFHTISLGLMENTKLLINKTKNYIIILAKYYIFRCKYATEIPNFNAFKMYLFRKINIEKHIAQSKDKLHIHNIKWEPFLERDSGTT